MDHVLQWPLDHENADDSELPSKWTLNRMVDEALKRALWHASMRSRLAAYDSTAASQRPTQTAIAHTGCVPSNSGDNG